MTIRDSSIFVPHGRQSTYMDALRAADALPRGLGEAMTDALKEGSIFDIGSSREQQRINIAKQTSRGRCHPLAARHRGRQRHL